MKCGKPACSRDVVKQIRVELVRSHGVEAIEIDLCACHAREYLGRLYDFVPCAAVIRIEADLGSGISDLGSKTTSQAEIQSPKSHGPEKTTLFPMERTYR